jgi:hypothetical protein
MLHYVYRLIFFIFFWLANAHICTASMVKYNTPSLDVAIHTCMPALLDLKKKKEKKRGDSCQVWVISPRDEKKKPHPFDAALMIHENPMTTPQQMRRLMMCKH